MAKDGAYVADGIAAGRSTFPHPKPNMDANALVEACRVQASTWVTGEFGVTVPAQLSWLGALVELIAGVIDAAEPLPGAIETDTTWYGLAQLDNAHGHALRAYHDHDDSYLLGCLFALINARAALLDGYSDVSVTDLFDGRLPSLDEPTLIETIRIQLNTWVPTLFVVPVWAPGDLASGPHLSDAIAHVLDAAQAAYGDMDDDDSVRGMAHLANARAHSLKVGYGHGDAELFAVLQALVLVAANLT
ncbi:hypothetical protein [Streptomyces sp. NPDC057636]|uniref:hypothetical protein n=1 Tax=Streptomyces sp. NPDC057636 TaxID=3346189 RepID=UPI00367C81AD